MDFVKPVSVYSLPDLQKKIRGRRPFGRDTVYRAPSKNYLNVYAHGSIVGFVQIAGGVFIFWITEKDSRKHQV